MGGNLLALVGVVWAWVGVAGAGCFLAGGSIGTLGDFWTLAGLEELDEVELDVCCLACMLKEKFEA